MIDFWRSRALTSSAAITVGIALAVLACGGVIAPIPSMAGRPVTTPLNAVIPALLAIVIARSIGGLEDLPEAGATRRVRLADIGVVAGLVTGFIALCLVGLAAGRGDEAMWIALRNVMAYTGVALGCLRSLGRIGAAGLPLLWGIAASCAGRSNGGSLHPWAVPVAPADSTAAIAAAVVILALGAVAFGRLANRPVLRALPE